MEIDNTSMLEENIQEIMTLKKAIEKIQDENLKIFDEQKGENTNE